MSGALYDLNEDGTITVTDDEREGRFDAGGRWLSGDIRTADPQLCGWIGGVQLPSRHQQMAEGSLFGDDPPGTPGGAE